jgi:hypothetical protein
VTLPGQHARKLAHGLSVIGVGMRTQQVGGSNRYQSASSRPTVQTAGHHPVEDGPAKTVPPSSQPATLSTPKPLTSANEEVRLEY